MNDTSIYKLNNKRIEITKKLYKYISRKERIVGFFSVYKDDERQQLRKDLFGNLIYSYNYYKIANKIIKIKDDRKRSKNDVLKELYKDNDLIILFNHIPNNNSYNLEIKLIDMKTIIINMYTKENEVTNKNMDILDIIDENTMSKLNKN